MNKKELYFLSGSTSISIPEEVAQVFLSAHDNAILTLREQGSAEVANFNPSFPGEEYLVWWRATVVDLLSAGDKPTATAWFAERGLEV